MSEKIPAPTSSGARSEAVKWLSPSQLLNTAREVVLSTVFARFADKREWQGSTPRAAYSFGGDDRDLLVDYAADTGDAYAPAYAVARSLVGHATVTTDELKHVCSSPPDSHKVADLLVLGGDQVYPVASHENYTNRFLRPFEHASKGMCPGVAPPIVMAIPGNHDWYDGLVGFRRIFCESWKSDVSDSTDFVRLISDTQSGEPVAGWAAVQSRSYLATELTHGWWLWAIDIQLDAPIDVEQLNYFYRAKEVVQENPNARIILCTARPSWIDADDSQRENNRKTLWWFIDRCVPDPNLRLKLLLAGDKHHYARYVPANKDTPFQPTMVTCGLGGAYFSSTHHLSPSLTLPLPTPPEPKLHVQHVINPPVPVVGNPPSSSNVTQTFQLHTRYPDKKTSRSLLNDQWKNIPGLNGRLRWFVSCLELTFLILSTIAMNQSSLPDVGTIRSLGDPKWRWIPAGFDALISIWIVPLALFLFVVGKFLIVFARMGLPTNTALARKRSLGRGHVISQYALMAFSLLVFLAVVECIAKTSSGHAKHQACWALGEDLTTAIAAVAVALIVGRIATYVFANYLYRSDKIGHHETEASSALRIEDFKGHLRIGVTKDGLDCHLLAIDKVPQGDELADPQTTVADCFTIPR